MITSDCHLHTEFSTDAEYSMSQMAESAIEKGLDTLCITDHMDSYFPESQGDGFIFDPVLWFDAFYETREKYRGRLRLLAGIELGIRNEEDIFEKNRSFNDELEKKYPFDFLLGSTHIVENMDPYRSEYWEGKTKEEAIIKYLESAAFTTSYYKSFDSYAHFDYVIRYNPTGDRDYNPADYSDLIDTILRNLVENGKALECNCGGLRKGLGFPNPKGEIFTRYRELGGELITIGSDAHRPWEIASNFSEACEMLKALGFRYYHVYENRKPIARPL